MLANYGIQAQTPHQVEPIELWPPSELVKVHSDLGKHFALKIFFLNKSVFIFEIKVQIQS